MSYRYRRSASRGRSYSKPRAKPRSRVIVVRSRAGPMRAAVQPRAPARKRSSRSHSNYVGRSLGGIIGSRFGGPIGGVLGSVVGGKAQDLFRSITGFGDYKVQSNSLMGVGEMVAKDAVPQFQNSGRGIRIQHREYLLDLISSASANTFVSEEFLIQPALQASFPWLSAIAEQFEEYKINGMIFEFKSNSADALNSVNTALGSVVMSTQYNVLSPSFANKVQMEQHEFSVSGKPSINIMHPIECARGESPVHTLSTRNGPVTSGDQRLYDFGRFTIASTGLQGTSVNIGELWVSYDITLLKPKINASSDVGDHYSLGAGITTSAYFGSSLPAASSSSDLGSVLTNTTITIPQTYTGNILVIYNVYGTSSAWVNPTFTASNGASNFNIFGNSSGALQTNYNVGGATSAGMNLNIAFTCVGGGKLTLSGGTILTSPVRGDLYVLAWPGTLTT